MTERVVDVDTATEPIGLTIGVKNIVDAIRLLLVDAEARTGDWHDAARDPHVREIVLGQLAFAGAHLARITELVTTTPSAIDEQRRELELEISDARADVMQAALDVVLAGVRSGVPSEAPPPK